MHLALYVQKVIIIKRLYRLGFQSVVIGHVNRWPHQQGFVTLSISSRSIVELHGEKQVHSTDWSNSGAIKVDDVTEWNISAL